MSINLPLSVRIRTRREDNDVTAQIDDLRFSSEIPGGYASLEISLNRPISIQPDDIEYYGRVYVYDSRHAGVMWEGRIQDPGRGAGSQGELWSITAVGPQSQLGDRTFAIIYVDQSLDRWERSQYSEQMATTDKGEIDSDTPCLTIRATEGTTTASTGPQWKGDFIYRALFFAGQKLARIRVSHTAGASTAVFQAGIFARIGAGAGAFIDTANWTTGTGAMAGLYGSAGFVDGMDNVSIAGYRATTSAVAGQLTWINFYNVVVRAALKDSAGTDITAAASYSQNTIKPAEVVADLLGRYLNQFDGATAVIGDSGVTIDQMAYPDGVTARQILDDIGGFDAGYYWAAWESNPLTDKYRFAYQAWPSVVRYEANVFDGFDSPGSATELYNAVTVRWTDARGKARTTRRTQTVQELVDAGNLIREAFIDLADEVGSAAAAIQFGDQFLVDHKAPPNAGTLRVARPIVDNLTGRMVMPWEIVPGYLIRVQGVLPRVDALNPVARDGVTVFRIVRAEFTASDASVSLELDSYTRSVSRTLARLWVKRPRKR